MGSCGDPPSFLSKRSLHDPSQVLRLNRKSSGDPGGVLSKRSLHAEVADAVSQRCFHESSCARLLGGSCLEILKDLLQQQQVLL